MDDVQAPANPVIEAASAPAAPPPPSSAGQRPTWRLPALVAVLGLLTALPIYAWIATLQSHDRSAAALAMPTIGMSRMGVFLGLPSPAGQRSRRPVVGVRRRGPGD